MNSSWNAVRGHRPSVTNNRGLREWIIVLNVRWQPYSAVDRLVSTGYNSS
jgi:hypothetical protein